MSQPHTGTERRAASTENAAVELTTPPAELAATLPPDGATPTGSLGLPEQFGRYRVRKLLGRGGMGAVYLAEDNMLERQVALKVPHHGTAGSPAALQRFYREARSAARLRHPHICPVYDVGEVESVPYLTMAFIEGEALASQVADYAARPPRDGARLARQLALALDEAHRQGVVHRDLKPSNVMIDRRGEPVIMDFGLAREVRTGSPSDTNPGTVLGTPAYMAPEQARGDVTAVGPGCDIYSLGALLFELLTGRVPFLGNALEVLVQQVRDQPPAPSSLRADLDGQVETICLKALAKEPSERFLSMGEFAQALADYLEGHAVCQPEQCCGLPPSLIAEGLVILRTWGWEIGHDKIRERLAARPDWSDDPTAKLLVDWLSGEGEVAKEAVEGLRA